VLLQAPRARSGAAVVVVVQCLEATPSAAVAQEEVAVAAEALLALHREVQDPLGAVEHRPPQHRLGELVVAEELAALEANVRLVVVDPATAPIRTLTATPALRGTSAESEVATAEAKVVSQRSPLEVPVETCRRQRRGEGEVEADMRRDLLK